MDKDMIIQTGFMSEMSPQPVHGHVFDDNGTYTRVCSKERDELENKLKRLYESSWCEIATSGLNAIFIALDNIMRLRPASIVLLADEVYSDTPGLVKFLCKVHKKTCVRFDQSDHAQVRQLFAGDGICCIFLESCSNPSSQVINWDLLSLAPKDTVVVVDNTWLSPVKLNPFKQSKRVNIVVDSCTKYLGGGACILGAINFESYDDIADACAMYICTTGVHVSATNCKLVADRLDSLEERVTAATERTQSVLALLKSRSDVKAIAYNYTYRPCVIRILVAPIEDDELGAIVARHGVMYATSFGKASDSIDPYPQIVDHKGGATWIRLAIGYASDDTFEARLAALLDEIRDRP
jgi:cystathionine beta-lyase/cystathionine gamma-synthase